MFHALIIWFFPFLKKCTETDQEAHSKVIRWIKVIAFYKIIYSSKFISKKFQDLTNPFNPKLIMQILPTIEEDMIEWCSEKWLFNQLSPEHTICCQILHTVWYISGERLKEKIEVDHSWEWKGLIWPLSRWCHPMAVTLQTDI